MAKRQVAAKVLKGSAAIDTDKAKALWKISEELGGVKFDL